MLKLPIIDWTQAIGNVVCCDCRQFLPLLPDESVSCLITSPPYFGLRDYKTEPLIWDGKEGCEHKWGRMIKERIDETGFARNRKGLNKAAELNDGNARMATTDNPAIIKEYQFCSLCGAWRGCLGLEPTIELYIKHLCDIYDQVKRVLRKDGTCWVNLADSYATTPAGNKEEKMWKNDTCGKSGCYRLDNYRKDLPKDYRLPAKSICLIPERFAIEMVNRGWILRNKIIWHKPNPMPSSATDRFTVDFENVFFFTKSPRYWFEQQFEPIKDETIERAKYGYEGKWHSGEAKIAGFNSWDNFSPAQNINPLGRNKRCVWTIPTEAAGGGVHFATFPRKLVEPMIKAGCPEFICNKCDKPREKIYQTKDIKRPRLHPETEPCEDRGRSPNDYGGKEIISFEYSDCGCRAGFRPGICLDIFAGLSTVASVAHKLDRDYIMVEQKSEYAEIGEQRLARERAQGRFDFKK